MELCLTWAIALKPDDLKLTDTGATLTNLITLLHNYGLSLSLPPSFPPSLSFSLSSQAKSETPGSQ